MTTTRYTYATDCHRERSNHGVQLFSDRRRTFGYTFAFYAVDSVRQDWLSVQVFNHLLSLKRSGVLPVFDLMRQG